MKKIILICAIATMCVGCATTQEMLTSFSSKSDQSKKTVKPRDIALCSHILGSTAVISDLGASSGANIASTSVGIRPSTMASYLAKKTGCFSLRDYSIALSQKKNAPRYLLKASVKSVERTFNTEESIKRVGVTAAAVMSAFVGFPALLAGGVAGGAGQGALSSKRVSSITASLELVCMKTGKTYKTYIASAKRPEIIQQPMLDADWTQDIQDVSVSGKIKKALGSQDAQEVQQILALAYFKAFQNMKGDLKKPVCR